MNRAFDARRRRVKPPTVVGVAVRLLAPAFAGAAVFAAASAHAQTAEDIFDRGANVPVLNRPHPEYEALGVRTGAWVFYPKIAIDATYDDNIFASQTGQQSDEFFTLQPQVVLQSDWARNALSFDAGASTNEYVSHSSEDTTDYHFGAAGRLDVDRDIVINADIRYSDNTLPRTAAAYTELTAHPLEYQETSVNVTGVDTMDRLRLTFSGQAYHDVYLNGTLPGGAVFVQDFRNNTRVVGYARADYAISPDIAVFAEENITDFIYDVAPDRDSWGTQTLAGVNFQVTHLMTGEVGIGYLTENYSDPANHSTGTFSGRAQLQWFPTQLVTVTLSGSQTIYDSGLADSPAFLARIVQLQADYELLRNLIVSARVGAVFDAYKSIDRNDDSYNAGLSATWLLNRGVGIAFTYSHLTLISSGLNRGNSFDDNRVGVALTLQR
jgi:hypothetical protein